MDEILNLIESVSEGFPTYFYTYFDTAQVYIGLVFIREDAFLSLQVVNGEAFLLNDHSIKSLSFL